MRSLTQQQLADRLYVTRSLVARWEVGLLVPSATYINKIAVILGVEIEVFDVHSIAKRTGQSETPNSSGE